MIKAVELRKGRTIIYEGNLAVVHDARTVAKGNKRSYMQAKIKSLKDGTIYEVRFNVDDRLEVPYVESKEYEYLYHDGTSYIFMDVDTFDQIPVSEDLVADAAQWLAPNQRVTCQVHEGQIVQIDVPVTVTLTVTDAPPVVKGATATNQLKDVTLETGARVRVPPFIETGEKINVDTRTGAYIERAK